MFFDTSYEYSVKDYPMMVNSLMKYIELVKTKHKDVSLLDIILDFSTKKGIPIEQMGDAISTDVYFKSFIEKDCELHKIYQTKTDVDNSDW